MRTSQQGKSAVLGQRCNDCWFDGSPQDVAQRLLGCLLVRKISGRRCSGIIVEVEAYLASDDPASHSARGPTPGNRTMFLSAGYLYVYPIHTRACLNVVTQSKGIGSAVLIRAIEPFEGVSQMARFRQIREEFKGKSDSIGMLRKLTSGPGRLCEALKVDRRMDGVDLLSSQSVWIEQPPTIVKGIDWPVSISRRIGITQALDLPLRWFIDGHQLVSGKASEHSKGRTWRFGLPQPHANFASGKMASTYGTYGGAEFTGC